jgi:predicted dehydrogenase
MRFALLGDHADGLDMARALVDSGRHELRVYSGPAVGLEYLRRRDIQCRLVHDLEEVLADPAIDAVIVAGSPAVRATQLRRALQSERHVLCVHPADESPDLGYEAAMLQGDTGHLLFPLLPETLHPALQRLVEIAQLGTGEASHNPFRLLELERWSTEAVLLDADVEGYEPGLPGWDVLRHLGGEIAELSAFSVPEEVTPDEPLLVTGRFVRGGLFQTLFVPGQTEDRWRLALLTARGRIELNFPRGWPGAAELRWRDEDDEVRIESWEPWDPWPALVESFEMALDLQTALSHRHPSVDYRERRSQTDAIQRLVASGAITPDAGMAASSTDVMPTTAFGPTWQDAIRGLELDDAARRSIERRRSSVMEYQEATEEAGFKGTMTLVGCALLWSSLLLLIMSVWIPWLGWAILPVFAVFLGMQLFRWIVPARDEK